jgi:hypothetical protein
MDSEWLAEYWPFLVGVAVIVVGNVYLYGVLGSDWRPGGPPFVLAIVVVVVIELGRSLYRRFG